MSQDIKQNLSLISNIYICFRFKTYQIKVEIDCNYKLRFTDSYNKNNHREDIQNYIPLSQALNKLPILSATFQI